MKRVLVVDDERPVIETIELMVRRDLAGEFSVVGDASSGRDAVEKAAALAPDIVLMDVWMPGISGLDAVREIRARGLPCVFILVTAYERFDIAREAMELGVLDYLLKPVVRDKLASALRAAAAFADRRFELERREMEHREREERLRSFVEEAFLGAVMSGDPDGFDPERYRAALGIPGGRVLVGAAAFLPPPGSPDPRGDVRALYAAFRQAVRYKTRALAGPLKSGFSSLLLSLPESGFGEAEAKSFRSDLAEAKSFRSDLAEALAPGPGTGSIRMGFSPPAPLEEAPSSWTTAYREALGLGSAEGSGPGVPGQASPARREDERAFLEFLLAGDSPRARQALDRILERLRHRGDPPPGERYRLVGLFAGAYRDLEVRGYLGPGEADRLLDLEDLRIAPGAEGLAEAARTRFPALAACAGNAPRWSAPVARAAAYIRENYAGPISLESAAAEIPLSPGRLSRLFVEETGRGFSDFLTGVRIEKAKELLAEPGASVKLVSSACGYPDPNYFARLFKKETGYTPSAFASASREGSDEKP
mgnify:CR=1 FL=1